MNFFAATALFFFSTLAFTQTRNLNITVKGIDKPKGFLMIELLDEFENRLEAKKIEVPKDADSMKIVFATNAKGPFAIRVFHDANGNGALDKNFMGIPKEKYGFSNNPRIIAGPPKYAELLFEWSDKPHVIHLK